MSQEPWSIDGERFWCQAVVATAHRGSFRLLDMARLICSDPHAYEHSLASLSKIPCQGQHLAPLLGEDPEPVFLALHHLTAHDPRVRRQSGECPADDSFTLT